MNTHYEVSSSSGDAAGKFSTKKEAVEAAKKARSTFPVKVIKVTGANGCENRETVATLK